jgi:hypothetical protein
VPYTEDDWQPFVALSAMRYAPTLPADSLARGLRLRPRRALIRQWVLPPDIERTSGLYAPQRHYNHPRVWAWLLAATAQDVERMELTLGGFYHFKRFSDDWMGDDAKPEATTFTFDELPVSILHLDNVVLELIPEPEPVPVAVTLPSTPPLVII